MAESDPLGHRWAVVQVAEQGIPHSWPAVLALLVLALHGWMDGARRAVEAPAVREFEAGPRVRVRGAATGPRAAVDPRPGGGSRELEVRG